MASIVYVGLVVHKDSITIAVARREGEPAEAWKTIAYDGIRLRKALDGQYDAIILAGAGLTRLGLDSHVTEWLSLDVMLPAPGQGALAIQNASLYRMVEEDMKDLKDELWSHRSWF